MSDPQQSLTSLIEKLEAATDEQVCDADWLNDVCVDLADACFKRSDAHDEPHWWFSGWHGYQPITEAPDWLFSIDAALTLLPAGAGWSVQGNDGISHAMVANCAGKSATPAIALCIASLKARAKLTETSHG